jgi:hypothetical protein
LLARQLVAPAGTLSDKLFTVPELDDMDFMRSGLVGTAASPLRQLSITTSKVRRREGHHHHVTH